MSTDVALRLAGRGLDAGRRVAARTHAARGTFALAASLSVAAASLFLVSPPLVRGILVPATGVLALSAALRRLRRSTGPDRIVYAGLAAGFGFMIIAEVVWLSTVTIGISEAALAPAIRLLLVAGYVAIAAAAVLSIAPIMSRDPGSVLEAATLAVATAAVLWIAVLAPSLAATDADAATRAYVFIVAFMLIGAAGIVLGVASNGATPRSARPALAYFLAAAVTAVAGNVLGSVNADPVTQDEAWWAGALWPVSFIAVWAALTHPSGTDALEVRRSGPAGLGRRRMLLLSIATLVTPVTAVLLASGGVDVDWLTGAVAHVGVLTMVVLRVGQLASAHREAEDRLSALADHDGLTGLPNRRAVDRRLAKLTAQVAKGDSAGVLVCFVDLDGFKAVNDARGHAAGDELLAAVATRLTGIARIHRGDLIARIGGDEFVILIEGDPTRLASALTARVHASFNEPFALTDGPATIRASIGIASATPERPRTLDELLSSADHEMYARKQDARRGTSARVPD